MPDLRRLLLADTDNATHRLIHHSSRPPRRREDAAVHVLEIEARARAVNLREKNDVALLADHRINDLVDDVHGDVLRQVRLARLKLLALHRALRLLNDVLALICRHIALLNEDVLNRIVLAENLLENLNLICKIAEDHEATLLLFLAEDLADLVRLRAVNPPVRAAIGIAH